MSAHEDCWPPGWTGLVFGQLGVVLNEHGQVFAVHLLHTEPNERPMPEYFRKRRRNRPLTSKVVRV